MSEQLKNMNPYSLEDIERYLQGKLSPAEMHELEKAAVQDPFLADAIEGYQATDLTIVKQDITDLHNRLSSGPAKIIPAIAKQNTWWRVAAVVVLLAGTGVLGLKLFIGKNNTQELAKTETVVPPQQDTSHSAAAIAVQKEVAMALQKKESAIAIQKNVLANNNRMQLSLKKSAAIDNVSSLDKKSLQPVAALPAKQQIYSESAMAKGAVVFDKVAEKDMIDAKTLAEVSVGKGTNIKGDTITLGRSEIAGFYPKPTEQAFTVVGGSQSLAVTGNLKGVKRSDFSIDTPIVMIDKKKMYTTFSAPAVASSTVRSEFEISKPKKDTLETLSEVVITGNTNYRYDKFPKKELSRPGSTAQADNAKGKQELNLRESSVAVHPTGGWYNFTKYLTDKIATKNGVGEHGTVEIKMNINESGKPSKVRILNSFNTQLNPIFIKAIRKGPRWKSTDYLAKKDFIFEIDL
ncbi:MAG: hypothetical protein V4557_01940 [Bacteroidota bacterium]